jgi:hypothetical protein
MENTGTQMQRSPNFDPSIIHGWGVDADRGNDPTYPMKTHREGEHDGYSWERPAQQQPEHEVLHSNERPNLAATFGDTLPPSGLSGMLRRAAFKYSENSYGHWVPLMLADRVQMVEGLVDDVKSGKFPNLWKELGYNAEWKHNKRGLITKLSIAAGAAVGLAAILTLRARRGGRDATNGNE